MGSNGIFSKEPNGEWLLRKQEFFTVGYVGGIKVVSKEGCEMGKIPLFSQTSSAYIGITREGKLTKMRIFKDHLPAIDIDLAHAHHHNVGAVHVHDFDLSNPNRPVRSPKARPMTTEESRLYGEIVKKMKEYKK